MPEKGKEGLWADAKAFRMKVRLAAVQVAALGREELASALAYEVEPFSKIPAAEAEVAWEPIADADSTVRAFDVVVARKGQRSGRKGRRGIPGGRNLRYFAGIIVVFAAIVADFLWISRKTNVLRLEVEAQTPLDAQIKRLEREASLARSEAARIRGEREAARLAQERAAELRSAYSGLLDAVAAVCGGRTVVKAFAGVSPFSVEMRAVAVSAEDAAVIMAELAKSVSEKGWILEPGGIAASAQGTTAEFSCRMVFGSVVEGGGHGRKG